MHFRSAADSTVCDYCKNPLIKKFRQVPETVRFLLECQRNTIEEQMSAEYIQSLISCQERGGSKGPAGSRHCSAERCAQILFKRAVFGFQPHGLTRLWATSLPGRSSHPGCEDAGWIGFEEEPGAPTPI